MRAMEELHKFRNILEPHDDRGLILEGVHLAHLGCPL